MSMDKALVDAVIAAAKEAGIPPEALLAVVEVESGGDPLERDGKTPRFLFERHVFYRMLRDRRPDRLPEAEKWGLAIPKWNRAAQYKDQGESLERLRLLNRARVLDEECANLSCSWGIGQTMGFVHKELGFASASEMVAWMTEGGVPAQIEAMVREIRNKGLIDELLQGRYADFARIYNGPGYAQNRYDTRIQAATDKWRARLDGRTPASDPFTQQIPAFELRAIQQRLKDLGFTDVGDVDGRLGRKTIGALSQFQAVNGLTVNGIYGSQTKARLADPDAERAHASVERLTTTAKDLRAKGSGTVKLADKVGLLSKGMLILGVGGVGEQTGALDAVKSTMDSLQAVRPLVDGVADLARWAASNWSVLALAAGVAGLWCAAQIIQRRVAQYRADANV